MINYYEILGVPVNAKPGEIKIAWRQLAKTLHPDTNRVNPEAEEQLKMVNEAYRVLSNKTKREEYDAQYKTWLLQAQAHSGASSPKAKTAGKYQQQTAFFGTALVLILLAGLLFFLKIKSKDMPE